MCIRDRPDTDLEWFAYWKEFCINWLRSLGIKDDELRARDHSLEELSFYSKATTDLEYLFPFGWGELWGDVYKRQVCARLFTSDNLLVAYTADTEGYSRLPAELKTFRSCLLYTSRCV